MTRCCSSVCCLSPGTRDLTCHHGYRHLCVFGPTSVGQSDTGLCCERGWKAGHGNLPNIVLEAVCLGCWLPLNICRDTIRPGLLKECTALISAQLHCMPEDSGDAWAGRTVSPFRISKHSSLGQQFQAAPIKTPLIWFLLQVSAFVKGHLSLAYCCGALFP